MLTQIANSKVLILGYGVEGKATLSYLHKHFPNQHFAIADKKAGENYLNNLHNYNLIIKSPGISRRIPELLEFEKNGGKITSATNLFFSQVQGSVIGVTGSKGKSTVSSLLYHVLKHAGKSVELIGNIGNPALEVLEQDSKAKFYVYEMSSYQLEDLMYKPSYALINNLFPEHLDYHGGVENYYRAKLNIAEILTQTPSKKEIPLLFYNEASTTLVPRVEKLACNNIPFNDGVNSKITNGKLFYKGEEIIDSKEVKLLGRHNLENILGVIAVSKELGIENAVIREAISGFTGLEHRLEYVGEFKQIRFYNDSISTTPESTIRAIESFGDDLGTLILGGLDRGYDFTALAKVILASSIENLILFPETGAKILAEIKKAQQSNPHAEVKLKLFAVKTMHECVALAFKHTSSGQICLLSPAAPSYNLFKNFVERGTFYKREIRNWHS